MKWLLVCSKIDKIMCLTIFVNTLHWPLTSINLTLEAAPPTLTIYQRWSPRGRPWPRGRPRGHILKSLALAAKSQVLKNCLVLGSRTALFLNR